MPRIWRQELNMAFFRRPKQLWLPLSSFGLPASMNCLVSRYPETSRPSIRRLLDVCPEAAQLAYVNPMLALTVAYIMPEAKAVDLAALVRQGQASICRACGFRPATPSLARLLARYPTELAVSGNVEALRDVWRNAWFRRALPHLARVNFSITYLLRRPECRPLISSRMLMQLSAANPNVLLGFIEATHEYMACVRLGLLPLRPIKSLHSPAEWVAQMEKLPAVPGLRLPSPPFPAGDGINPLVESWQLIEEGERLRTCAGTLIIQRKILDRELYLYRITRPMPATLLLERNCDDVWILAQVRARDNADAPPEVLQHVERWLAGHLVAAA